MAAWRYTISLLVLKKYFTRNIFRHLKRNFVSPRGHVTGADPGFFLGRGALVSCSTSTPMNHIVFFGFCRIPVVLGNRRSPQGGGVRIPCTLPLDPPLCNILYFHCIVFLFMCSSRGITKQSNAVTSNGVNRKRVKE